MNRQTPSEGLSIQQMLGAMNSLELSPAVLPLPKTRADSEVAGSLSLFAIVCRYVNSNLPPIVVSRSHAWLVVAYTREQSGGHSRLTLYRHDDAAGPYIRVDDPWSEPHAAHQPWLTALLPLPPKIYMTAERAESVGRWWFGTWMASLLESDPLRQAAESGELTYLTYGMRARDYKHALARRTGFDPALAKEYRLSPWPRSIWVVELVDRRLRGLASESVLGEVIIDATANHYPSVDEPGILATHASGSYFAATPDHGSQRTLTGLSLDPYESGRLVR